ncbi:MAG TPA: hypothetical protein DCY75_05685, partial [Clostridiales bacterium]|nr:hypothetical protein [Clostridiales bacterium]
LEHYDRLIDENNDPVHDPERLQSYMNRWDGMPFMDLMQLDLGKTALEIGIGTGRLAIQIASRCKALYGIDISQKTVARAKENLATHQNVFLIHGDFLDFPFDRTFDVLYSSLTWMHIQKKAEAMKKAASLLEKGGRFVLSIDKNQKDFLELGTRKVKIYPDSVNHIRDCVQAAGLVTEQVTKTAFAYLVAAVKI